MGITKKHLKILECYEYDDYVLDELIEILDISKNRIQTYTLDLYQHYKVKKIEDLKQKIRTDENWRKKIKKELDISSNDRKNFILINLLNNDIVKLNNTIQILGVTRRTLTKDLINIRKLLDNYQLEYISLNSKGIKILGNEDNKKKLLNKILFSIFLEKKYLPNIFDFLFEDFNNYIDKNVKKFIIDLFRKKNIIEQTYLILKIEILVYIGLKRNKGIFNFCESRYEMKLIKELCKKNQISKLSTNYKKEYFQIDKFIEYIRKKTNFNIAIPEKTYITLLTRFELIAYKNKFNIKEFYLINRKLQQEYQDIFDILMNSVNEYFKDTYIDSLDKVYIFLILKKYIYIKEKPKIAKNNRNILVFSSLQILLLEEIIEEIRSKGIEIDSLVSEYTLEAYLADNIVNNILILESIDLNKFTELNITIIRSSLPMGEMDYLKIKKYLDNTSMESE